MPPNIFPNADAHIRETMQQHWSAIQTRQSRNNHRQDWYNFRMTREGHQQFPEYLRQILADQSTAFKINLAFGFILRNNETAFIKNNKAIVTLECDYNTGTPYQDWLSFFRCLTLHNGAHTRNLQRDTNHYFRQYEVQMASNLSRFKGVTLQELNTLEKLYEVNIMVYSLAMGDEQEQSPQPFAALVHRSHHDFPTTMYLNLYKDSFSYIKDFAR
ncbi:hypothetical protein AC249_AIPGENE10298 [Exaiptasia diaphana]|nr:hypothetical protein AC249_AIPGENE10298 [Exaiptasia diaphana]